MKLPENIILPVTRISQVFNILMVNVNEVTGNGNLQRYQSDVGNLKSGVRRVILRKQKY